MPDPVLTWCAAVTTDATNVPSWQYSAVGDMEWGERNQMAVTRRRARCDPTTMRLVAAVIETAEQRRRANLTMPGTWDVSTQERRERAWKAIEQATEAEDAALAALAAHLGEGTR